MEGDAHNTRSSKYRNERPNKVAQHLERLAMFEYLLSQVSSLAIVSWPENHRSVETILALRRDY